MKSEKEHFYVDQRLRYKNTIEDILAFQEYYVAHSPAMRNQFLLGRWVSALAVLLLSVLVVWLRWGSQITAFIGLFGAILTFFITPPLMRWSIRRHTRQIYQEGKQKGFLGEHFLEADYEGLVERTDVSETKTTWQGIERLVSTETHTFIFTSSVSAHVIPNDRVTEGNLQEFVLNVERYLAFASRLPA